jgi:hypothetical protein
VIELRLLWFGKISGTLSRLPCIYVWLQVTGSLWASFQLSFQIFMTRYYPYYADFYLFILFYLFIFFKKSIE